MKFIPETPKQVSIDIPYYDDVKVEDGWQGHTTSKSIATLKLEITLCMQRLGGVVLSFQQGTYLIGEKKRDGFQIHYTVEVSGILHRGQLDIAALPVRDEYRLRRTLEKRKENSLKMSLYMVRKALEGTWFLQKLSHGYAPLMPWMLSNEGKTITQLWSEQVFLENLLPASTDFAEWPEEAMEGEIVE